MAERYKLPDALGGGEYEGSFEERLAGVIRLNFNGRAIYVPVDMLTKTPAPIPPEPEPGAYLLRRPDGEVVILGHGREWVASGGWSRWSDFWEEEGGTDVTITRLVPERVETVELPWRMGDDYSAYVKVDPECMKRVRFGFEGVIARSVEPDMAREIAAAFAAAASRAE